MSVAAAISTPLRASSLRSLTSPSLHPHRSSPSCFHLRLQYKTLRRNSNLRISPIKVMDIAAQETPSPIPLLDRSENRVLHFVKYHGLGNDFIMVDNRDSSEPRVTPGQAVQLCDRNFGIGADGVIFVMPGIDGTDYTMRIFNSDGSEPEMCGNGVRCFAKFIADLCNINGKQSFTISTGAGLIVPEIQDDGKVRVDMGEPVLTASKVPTKLAGNNVDESVVKTKLEVDGVSWIVTCVSMGNPHCVTFGREGNESLVVDELDLTDIGPKFEHHLMFPARTNTEFVQVYSRSHLKMRVWERGAGATLACGTGACAVVVAGVLEGRADRNCTVDLPGGPLEIYWDEQNNHVYMTGPAQPVFYGSVLL